MQNVKKKRSKALHFNLAGRRVGLRIRNRLTKPFVRLLDDDGQVIFWLGPVQVWWSS